MLDNDVLTFVRASVRSTWALELLLLLHKQAPQASAEDELVRSLRASATLVSACLEQLQAARLVMRDENGQWLYAASAPMDALTAKLQRAYDERPVAVVNAIVSSPNDRLKSFADAFRFPKKKDD